jgi:hypothetical protein
VIGDEGTSYQWPEFQPGSKYVVNNIYDVAPSFLGDLSAYFTQNPFPVPIEQVSGYQNTARVLGDSGPIAAAQATMEFDNLPDQYFGLAIRYIARSDAAQSTARINMQFNGDTGANYHATLATRTGITWANIITQHNLNQCPISQITAATAPAGVPGSGLIEIPGYASGVFTTTIVCKGTVEVDPTLDGSLFDVLGAGHWNSTAPITQVVMGLNVGNFVPGSRVVLYGF